MGSPGKHLHPPALLSKKEQPHHWQSSQFLTPVSHSESQSSPADMAAVSYVIIVLGLCLYFWIHSGASSLPFFIWAQQDIQKKIQSFHFSFSTDRVEACFKACTDCLPCCPTLSIPHTVCDFLPWLQGLWDHDRNICRGVVGMPSSSRSSHREGFSFLFVLYISVSQRNTLIRLDAKWVVGLQITMILFL